MLVEHGGDRAADLGDLVEADAVVAVHHDLDQPPAARLLHVELLELETGCGDGLGDYRLQVAFLLVAHVDGAPCFWSALRLSAGRRYRTPTVVA
ncbi:hypothetical protein GCM10010171_37750 [Actinokineospora fastidiosa]|uniref:Uncharacterized protein n=1 Tax=Actinokineospora fastidiosa TaxID=1816 RepID=A0A918GHV8_9PSEU|nr:hypothetical protein GCM10010171_37750 [Actinokineospora fastidiosa]